jgi:creatinine amidohydrolase/Fe(II)-dependent formamide hydrolase-like protein
MKYITLREIEEHNPCEGSWPTIVAAEHLHGGDYDKPFPMSAGMDATSMLDAAWALRCKPELEREARLFACWCARQVVHLTDDARVPRCIETAERYADGEATQEELSAAWDAARAAARAAAWDALDAARAAAWDALDAARAAARAAAWDARAAARAAAWDARAAARAAAWDARDAALVTAGEGKDFEARATDKLREIFDGGYA